MRRVRRGSRRNPQSHPRDPWAGYSPAVWVLVVLLFAVAVAMAVLVRRSPHSPPREPNRVASLDLEAERLVGETDAAIPDLVRQVEADAAALTHEIEAEATQQHSEIVGETEQEVVAPGFPRPDDQPVMLGSNGGPTWMPPDEWTEKVAAYRAQRRTTVAIREIAVYLERRGPRWPPNLSERSARAARLGMVIREEYMTPEQEALALEPGPDGLPDAWLERVRDRLLVRPTPAATARALAELPRVVTPEGWVNPRSRTAASRAGLWSFVVRGTAHHESAARRGDFTPGAPVRLVREPDNPHDPNAIAVYADQARKPAGYVPRGYAKRLAKLIDAGADVVAVSTRGSKAGHDAVSPHVLAVEPALWEHLNRER